MQRSSVDLPEPEGPMRHITSPLLTCTVTPSSATKLPYSLRTLSYTTTGAWPADLRSPFIIP